jgi:precorrin-2 dehydrogenase/sirohydrochlorin ferrochelatase
MKYFPVCLDLKGQPCLVIGEGRLAEEKVQALSAAGANVRLSKEFDESEALGSFLMIVVTQDHVLGGEISKFARQHHILVNVLDQTENCNFIFPAVMRQGDLSIAVSSSGKSPLLAVSIRDQLKRQYGPEYAELLNILGNLRKTAKEALPRYHHRKSYYLDLMHADLLSLLRSEGRSAVEQKAHQMLRTHRMQSTDAGGCSK